MQNQKNFLGHDEIYVEEAVKKELKEYRKYAKTAAKELGYGAKVQKKIDGAESIGEIERIMIDARHGKIEEEAKKNAR